MKKTNIVVIGGGTGLAAILRGLKTFPVNISAIVTVADDGGSSGVLRDEFDIPPPGDVRNVLAALSEVEPLVEELLQHRFPDKSGLQGHSLGNLLLTAMTAITGDFAKGVQEISKVFNVNGTVLPAANRGIVLSAEMTDGTIVEGESVIPTVRKRIHRVFLTPDDVEPLPETIAAINRADLIIIGPGSLYTSVLPNLLVPGISAAIKQSKSRKIYICNVMTQPGETEGYAASDHVLALINHVGPEIMDTVIVNEQKISNACVAQYKKLGAYQVVADKAALAELPYQIVYDELLFYRDRVLRHDAIKLSQLLLSLI